MILALGLTLLLVQDNPVKDPQKVLSEIVPNPTGQNGYEDFIVAGVMIGNTKSFEEAHIAEKPRLKQVRDAVTDNQRALQVFRNGLAKSVHIDSEANIAHLAFAYFRNIGLLLSMEERLLLSGGKVAQALQDFQDGYALAYEVSNGTIIDDLVGRAIAAISIVPIALHLDQLDYSGCNRLLTICQDIDAREDRTPAVMRAEFEFMTRHRAKGKDEFNAEEYVDDPENETPDENEFVQRMSDPDTRDQTLREVTEALDHFFTLFDAQLAKSSWERDFQIDLQAPDPLALRIVNQDMSMFTRYAGKSVADKARIRLLGVHAAILSYRWWHNALPPKLDALNLGDFATDPFTGKPLIYKLEGFTYKLYSAGENKVDDGGSVDGDFFVTRDGRR